MTAPARRAAPEPMTVGSLFAGIGGFDLAAREIGWTTAWYSEIDPYASAVMARHFPEAVNLGDIRTITDPPAVDVLCGGFPCQDISRAGRGLGIDGERSGLWRECARVVRALRPSYVVVENVAALLGRGVGRVLGDLAAIGYDAEWSCVSACALGAPHPRERLLIVAYPTRSGLPERRGRQAERLFPRGGSSTQRSSWWDAEPDVGRVALRLPRRVDRLRCLGNAVVPQVAAVAFRVILEMERAA